MYYTIYLGEWHRSAPFRTQLHTVIKQFPGPVLQDYNLTTRMTPFRRIPHPVTYRYQETSGSGITLQLFIYENDTVLPRSAPSNMQ